VNLLLKMEILKITKNHKNLITVIFILGSIFFIYTIPKIYAKYSAYNDNKEFRVNFPKKKEYLSSIPNPDSVFVYIMAGQSNMAGRGKIEPIDTIPNNRLLTLDKQGQLILAKEPLHYYEPSRTGLDCGVSFGTIILKKLPQNNYVLVLPTAVGGSSIQQWINDSTFRDVKLLSNFKEKVELGKKYGTIKSLLWHQGENDATNEENINLYQKRLSILFSTFRKIVKNDTLPIIIGELGSYYNKNEKWQRINNAIHTFTKKDKFSEYITTQDFNHRGDGLHFDSNGQRKMGERFANKYFEMKKPAYNTVYN
jgi:hypothetical protein